MFILWKFKRLMQKSIFPQKIQKSLCITTKSLYTNSNFKRNYLENYNDSEHAVKTKNAPFFMIFPNISFFSYDCKLLDWSVNKFWNFFCSSCTCFIEEDSCIPAWSSWRENYQWWSLIISPLKRTLRDA